MLKLYSNIKKRRLELHMTQDQLALKMGYSDKGMISKIEKGLVDISYSKILEFSDVLNIDPVSLMGWNEIEPESTGSMDSNIITKITRLPEYQIPKLNDYLDLLDLQAKQEL